MTGHTSDYYEVMIDRDTIDTLHKLDNAILFARALSDGIREKCATCKHYNEDRKYDGSKCSHPNGVGGTGVQIEFAEDWHIEPVFGCIHHESKEGEA